ncbi:MAG: DUF2281 domain-containing protein [Phormidium sp.]
MIHPIILEKLEQLPESLQKNVLHYIEFLLEKHGKKSTEENTPKKYRVAGTMEGMIIMPDDFDEPLADLEEYLPESNPEITEKEKPKKRRSGILKGTFVLPLPDDFDEPLEEFEV